MNEPLKRLPLHDAHVAAGARFAPFAGYEMPVRYGSIKEEHAAVRTRAGMFDVSHMGEVFVRGRDALDALNRLVTNDLRRLALGQALYTVMCKPDGGIVDDLIIYRLGDEEVLVCVNASNRAKDFAWICDHLEGDCHAVDDSDAWVQLAVQGPNARAIVAALAPSTDAVAPFHAAWADVAGARVLAARTGYTGEDGFELYIPVDAAQRVFDAIVAAGAPHGLVLAGLGCRDTLRLEAKLPLYGNDLDEQTNPLEAGLGWVVKFDGRDFIGRDALIAARDRGLARRLRCLTLQGPGVLRHGYEVFVGDARVGVVTSGGVAPSLNDVSIGLAYIDAAHADASTVDVDIRGRRVPAAVSTKPFYQRPR